MKTIGLVLVFLAKALMYGVGLGFGFWMAGWLHQVLDYYMSLYTNDRKKFWIEVKGNGFNPLKWRYAKYEEKEHTGPTTATQAVH